MKKYHHRKHYSRNNQSRGLRGLIQAVLQIVAGLFLLFLMPYILPVYIFLFENPIFIVPVGMVILLIAGGIYWYIRKKKHERYVAIQKFSEVMKLDWREFEEFVAEILKQKGFHTILGVGIKDGGVDVTATYGDRKFFVQCKHYSTDNITVEKIRELNGVMNGETIPVGGIFVTTSGFTVDAIFEANKYGIELWDKNYIIEFLQSSDTNIGEKLTKETSFGVCEKCGGKLVLRTAHNGPNAGSNFLGCENFPECHFTKNI